MDSRRRAVQFRSAMSAALITIYGCWLAWVVSWGAASLWSARTVARPSFGEELPYRILQTFGAVAVFYGRGADAWPAWSPGEPFRWLMAVLVVSGFLFAWWARLHLGSLWSGTVQRKEGHRVVDTGPYRFVRHPIYTGLLLSVFAVALARGEPIALIGAGVTTYGWYLKARLEERLLRAELGASAYDAYARRTPMLVPMPWAKPNE